MSKRNLIIAAVVLVLLAFVSQWFGRSGNKVIDEKIGNPLLAAKQVEAFDQLTLRNSEGSLTLQKQADQWIIREKEGYPADMKKLLELVDKLTTTTIASLVTKDESRQEHFQVVYWDEPKASSSASGTQLTLTQKGQTVFRMMTGKERQSKSEQANAPTHPDGVYVRVGENPAIYLLKDNLGLDTAPVDWIQTSLFKLDKKEIQSVKFEVAGEQFLLERPEKGKDMTLKGLAEKEKLAEFELSSVLSDLEDFKIEEAFSRTATPEKDLALKSIITVSLYDAPSLTFKVLSKLKKKSADSKENEESYYISFVQPEPPSSNAKWNSLLKLNKNWLFEMDDWKAKHWLKKRKDFLEEKKKK